MGQHQATADTLYEVLAGNPVSGDRLARAADWFAASGISLERHSFLAYMETLQQALPADGALAQLVPRWRAARAPRGGFGAADAQAFLQDYTAALDPNLLFRAPITTGYTHWDSAGLRGGFAFAREIRHSWSLLFCDRGGARLRAGGRELQVAPGQLLLIDPGALCTLHPLRGCADWGYYWAVFSADSRWREWLAWPHFAARVGCLTAPARERDKLAALFRELGDSLQPGHGMGVELGHNLLEQIILRCRALLPADYRLPRDPRIERARSFVESRYSEAFTLAQVAAAASLSPSRLAALFRAQCGLSVFGYRDELRMVQAARLLRDTPLDVAAVGAAVGYADPAFFSRTFSRHVGMSPRVYRHQG